MNLLNFYKKINISKLTSIKHSKSDLRKMLNLRNQKYIRENMYNCHIIKTVDHNKWLKDFINNNHQSIYLIKFNQKYSGSIILKNESKKNKRADWAYYLDKNSSVFLGFIV